MKAKKKGGVLFEKAANNSNGKFKICNYKENSMQVKEMLKTHSLLLP